jgi:predicted nucleic acid-binding protein
MTRSALVVDTSVAIKWIVDEPGSDEALALQGRDLAAPALLRVEAANALRTISARGAVDARDARRLFGFLQTAPVVIVDHDDALESRALDLALELNHSVYDCLYLALAERMERTLVTADRRFLGIVASTPYAGLTVDVAAAGV